MAIATATPRLATRTEPRIAWFSRSGGVARHLRCTPSVTPSDRAFRALGREEPDALAALLEAAGIGPSGHLRPVDVTDPKLDAPPHPVEADFVAHTAEDEVLHVECQGYRDASFEQRLSRYHLALVLRFWPRPVHTVTLWLQRPPDHQRAGVLSHGNVRVHTTPLVLPELSAEHLLRVPAAACFAPAADRGDLSEEELARRVVARLIETGASPRRRYMAGVAALVRGSYRFECLVRAAKELRMEPVIIEEFVRYGEDLGLEKGLAKGRAEGKAEGKADAILVVLAARGIAVPDDLRTRILACSDLATLDAWTRRALTVATAADLVS